jgi:hypothetical protein
MGKPFQDRDVACPPARTVEFAISGEKIWGVALIESAQGQVTRPSIDTSYMAHRIE